MGVPDRQRICMQAKISNFLINGTWLISHEFQLQFPDICIDIWSSFFVLGSTDELLWLHSPTGAIIYKDVYDHFRHRPVVCWANFIWKPFIFPQLAIHFGILCRGWSYHMLMSRGLFFTSIFHFCKPNIETQNHPHELSLFLIFLEFSCVYPFKKIKMSC